MATPIPKPFDDEFVIRRAYTIAESASRVNTADAPLLNLLARRYAQYSEALDRIARWDETPVEERSARNVATIAKVARGPLP